MNNVGSSAQSSNVAMSSPTSYYPQPTLRDGSLESSPNPSSSTQNFPQSQVTVPILIINSIESGSRTHVVTSPSSTDGL